MSSISERYARMAEDFGKKVAAVQPSRWSDPSPCEGWTARDVVRHVVDAHGIFLRQVGRSLGDIPSVDDDPLGAFEPARAIIQGDLDDPQRASAEYDGFFGRTSFEQAIGRFLVGDLLVHGWDLARATGVDEHLDSEEVRVQLASIGETPEAALRSPGVYGVALQAPPGADEQTKLLAFTGRKSWE